MVWPYGIEYLAFQLLFIWPYVLGLPTRGRFLVRFSFSDIHRDSSIKCRRLPTPNFCATKNCQKSGRTCSTFTIEKSIPEGQVGAELEDKSTDKDNLEEEDILVL